MPSRAVAVLAPFRWTTETVLIALQHGLVVALVVEACCDSTMSGHQSSASLDTLDYKDARAGPDPVALSSEMSPRSRDGRLWGCKKLDKISTRGMNNRIDKECKLLDLHRHLTIGRCTLRARLGYLTYYSVAHFNVSMTWTTDYARPLHIAPLTSRMGK